MRTFRQVERDLERAHMRVAHYMSLMVARHEQVKALRIIAKKLYLAIKRSGTWTVAEGNAMAYYEKEMSK